MNLYILDTDHTSLFQRGHACVASKILNTSPDQLAISIITAEEQLRGRLSQIRKADSSATLTQAYARLRELLEYLSQIHIIGYSTDADAQYQTFRRQGLRIGTQDLRIASIVVPLDAILVTRNQRDFERVPGLSTEDWSQP